ncbi:MAG: hypothetical protein HY866_14110, partial [Chloroflexi bacterium]|nr:hypothetical protein [Chloroflexota bacterium]
ISGPAAAQTETGAICVQTFADSNANGLNDSGETTLPGVNVNLSVSGVILATHITAPGETQYCFENLLRGIYTINFTDSPTYRTTTAREGTFALEPQQRLTIDPFGAFPVSLDNLRAETAAQIAAAQPEDEPLESSMRLLLSTVGAMMVMLFMIGAGAVVLGLISGRREAKKAALPPPPFIAPPPPRPGDFQRATYEHGSVKPADDQ